MLQQFSDAVFTPKRPLFGGGTMTQAGSGQYEKVIACYRNNSMQNFFALPLVHHPGPLRALRVGLWGYPGPWGNPESQTGGGLSWRLYKTWVYLITVIMRKKTLACQVDITACHIIIFMPKIKPEVFNVIMRNHVGGRKRMA